jgi:hypothetical protein
MTDPSQPVPRPTPADATGESAFPGSRRAALAAYIDVNRERFTEAALREAALDAGYTAEEFAAVWPTVGWARPDASGPSRVSFLPAAGTFVGFILVLWLGAVLLENVTAMSGMYIGPIMPVLWIGMLVAAVIGWVVWRDSHPSVARGLGCAVIAVGLLPIVAIVAVLGFCLVTGATLLGT